MILMRQKGFAPLLIVLAVVILGVIGFLVYKTYWPKISAMVDPQNYEDCLKAPGSMMQPMYPAVCVAKSGARFTEPLPPPSASPDYPFPDCNYNGKTYKDGQNIPSPDKCNSCSCENGQVACTAMACQ